MLKKEVFYNHMEVLTERIFSVRSSVGAAAAFLAVFLLGGGAPGLGFADYKQNKIVTICRTTSPKFKINFNQSRITKII